MSAELVGHVARGAYPPPVWYILDAFLSSARGVSAATLDEDRLKTMTGFKALTLRAALATLCREHLLREVTNDGRRCEIRRWTLDLREFERVVRDKARHVREALATVPPAAAAHCERCNLPVHAEELASDLCCHLCGAPLGDPSPPMRVTLEDTACLHALEEQINRLG